MTIATAAHARDWQVSADTSMIGTQDPNWELLHSGNMLPSGGATIGMGVRKNMSAVIGFHTGTVGSRIIAPSDEETEYEWGEETSSFQIAATVHQYSAGARWRWTWTERLNPTVTTQALLGHSRMRMDENIELEGSEVAVSYGAVAPGLAVTAGLEYTPFMIKKARVVVGVDLGYAHYMSMNFKDRDSASDPIDIGSLSINGFAMKWSVGTRF
jgi:hypothetical protein